MCIIRFERYSKYTTVQIQSVLTFHSRHVDDIAIGPAIVVGARHERLQARVQDERSNGIDEHALCLEKLR